MSGVVYKMIHMHTISTQYGTYINHLYIKYDFCPECRMPYGNHKMDCSRGRT